MEDKSEQGGGENIYMISMINFCVNMHISFRMSLVIMIFVNYGGGGYWFFDHSIWNGLTVADLVFPWFIWIMGVSMVFSFHGRRKDSTFRTIYQIIRRTVILFAVGIFLSATTGVFISTLYEA